MTNEIKAMKHLTWAINELANASNSKKDEGELKDSLKYIMWGVDETTNDKKVLICSNLILALSNNDTCLIKLYLNNLLDELKKGGVKI